jgi:hypothetical protein
MRPAPGARAARHVADGHLERGARAQHACALARNGGRDGRGQRELQHDALAGLHGRGALEVEEKHTCSGSPGTPVATKASAETSDATAPVLVTFTAKGGAAPRASCSMASSPGG